MMIAMEKQSPYKEISKLDITIGLIIGFISQYWQFIWMQQFVNIYVLGILYGIGWTYCPILIQVKSWKKISITKLW